MSGLDRRPEHDPRERRYAIGDLLPPGDRPHHHPGQVFRHAWPAPWETSGPTFDDVATCGTCGRTIFRTNMDGRWHHPGEVKPYHDPLPDQEEPVPDNETATGRRGDAELASVMRKLLAGASFVSIDQHGAPIFTLDDTTVSVTEDEVRALEEAADQ